VRASPSPGGREVYASTGEKVVTLWESKRNKRSSGGGWRANRDGGEHLFKSRKKSLGKLLRNLSKEREP